MAPARMASNRRGAVAAIGAYGLSPDEQQGSVLEKTSTASAKAVVVGGASRRFHHRCVAVGCLRGYPMAGEEAVAALAQQTKGGEIGEGYHSQRM